MKEAKTKRGNYNRYSIAFKMQVVEEAENGLISAERARQRIPSRAGAVTADSLTSLSRQRFRSLPRRRLSLTKGFCRNNWKDYTE